MAEAKAAADLAGVTLKEGTKQMVEYSATSMPTEAAKQIGQQLYAALKVQIANRPTAGRVEEQKVQDPPVVTAKECVFCRMKEPCSIGEEGKYRWIRLVIGTDDLYHVRYKLYHTEAAWKAAMVDANALTPPHSDFQYDAPLPLRYCTTKTTKTSVEVSAPNPSYSDATKGYIDRLLVVRKIKFDKQPKLAQQWTILLSNRTGDDHGYPHVDTNQLTGKIMQAAVHKFQTHQMGAPKSAQRLAFQSREAMANVVLAHVVSVAIRPTYDQVKVKPLPVINRPMPAFVTERSFKAVIAQVNKQLGSRMASAFRLIEMVVQELAGRLETFINRLVAWISENILQPIFNRVNTIRGPKKEAEEAKAAPDPDAHKSFRERITEQAMKQMGLLDFGELFANLTALLARAGIDISLPAVLGFDPHHYQLMVTDEMEALIQKAKNEVL